MRHQLQEIPPVKNLVSLELKVISAPGFKATNDELYIIEPTASNTLACPKFNKCSAAICPLDSNWNQRSHLEDDSVCFYLLESVKKGAKKRFEGDQLQEVYGKIVEVRSAIQNNYKRIAKKLQLSKNTTSRMIKKFKSKKGVL